MTIKKCFIDTETTGLDPKANGILEIAGIIETDNSTEEFLIECSPFKDDVVDKKALEVNRVSEKGLFKRTPPKDAYRDFTNILSKYVNRYKKQDKFFFFAYNAKFDFDFLRAWFYKNDDKYFGSWFFYPAIDVAVLAAMYLRDERSRMINFKQTTVAPVLGIDIDESKAHGALYDTRVMKAIFDKVTEGGI